MPYKTIESRDNTLIKKIVKLSQSSSYRKELGLAVIYGAHLVDEAIKHNILENVIVVDSSIAKFNNILENEHLTSYVVTQNIIEKINLLDSFVEIVGVIRLPQEQLIDYTIVKDYILLENIQDPGNLGTILRVAMACGINSICLSANCVDIYNPKVIRSSQGLQFGLNIYTNIDLYDFVTNYLGKVIATTPHTDKNLYDYNLKQSIAWVFGNEGAGVTSELLAKVNNLAKIPMIGQAESLNIAMAVTVCVFEMARQRIC